MKARKVKGLKPRGATRAGFERIIAIRLAELRELAPGALEPGAAEAQHDLRIAAKRLRYVLEIAEPCFGSEAGRARRVAKDLQGVLGDLHDCDVMIPRVAGVGSLESLLRARRELLFASFRDLWSAEETRRTLERLGRLARP